MTGPEVLEGNGISETGGDRRETARFGRKVELQRAAVGIKTRRRRLWLLEYAVAREGPQATEAAVKTRAGFGDQKN